jgi:hypothetical protein
MPFSLYSTYYYYYLLTMGEGIVRYERSAGMSRLYLVPFCPNNVVGLDPTPENNSNWYT